MPSLYDRYVVPWLINCACSNRIIQRQRAKIVPEASGRVLELGMGSGLNLPFYDHAKVEELDAVEPSDGLRQKAEAAVLEAGLKAEVSNGIAEALPYGDHTFDCVVCTFTLC